MAENPEELRNAERYLISFPLHAVFGATAVTVLNLGASGLQAEHAEPLKLGAEGRLICQLPGLDEKIALRGRVVWSRLSKTPNAKGKYLYRSGVRFDPSAPFPQTALDHLASLGMVASDGHSLERKREAMQRREQQKSAQFHAMRMMTPEAPPVPPEQVLLVQHARGQLRDNPQEAQKWYQRARFAPPVVDGSQIAYREDVVAIWEYLGRTVDIEIVSRVFEEKKTS